ncbi:MAG: DUF72 domain-containing protein [Sandaracinaceae bacterium]
MRQLDLFADPLPPPDPTMVALGRGLPAHMRLGTSSWTFEGWKGLLYKRTYPTRERFVRESLREYASSGLFRTVGFDRSYYAPLSEAEWAEQGALVPDDFIVCAKVWDRLTARMFPDHPRYGERRGQVNLHYLDPVRFEEQVLTPFVRGLGGKAGPLIVELPPAPSATDPIAFADSLARFLVRAPPHRYAFELREPQLLTRRYVDVLRDHPHASHVLNLHTRMPPLKDQVARGALVNDTCVVRLMIPRGQRYAEMKERYAPFDRIHEVQRSMRDDVEDIVERTGEAGADLFVIVNNKVEGCSVLTAMAIAERAQRCQ